MMTGRMALSSKLPCDPASATAVSLPMHLDRDHHQRLALRRVDLARHDRRTGFVSGQQQFAETAPRAGGQPPHVVGDLHQRRRPGRAVPHGRAPSGRASQGPRTCSARSRYGDPVSSASVDRDVERRSPSGAFSPVPTAVPPTASSSRPWRACSMSAMTCARVGRRSPTTPGRRVSGTASSRWVRPILTIFIPFGGLRPRSRRAARCTPGISRVVDRGDCSNVHRGGEGVVAALAHVHVVVRSHRLLAAQLAAEQLDGAVGQDLVDVHIALGARTGLPDDRAGTGHQACPLSPRRPPG